MGVASLRLHDGTVITATFDDNHDGMIQADERSRAQSALRAELRRLGREGDVIDASASIYILEDGTSASAPGARESMMPAGDLARTGTVRLFGANPARTTTGYSDPALWAPSEHEVMADGTRAVIYHEANRWDETTGSYVWGRTLRVDERGGTSVWHPTPDPHAPGYWEPIADHVSPAGNRIPTASLRYIPPERLGLTPPPNDGAWHKVSVPEGTVTPRTWTFAGVREGYAYFTAPGDHVARRSLANPDRDEFMAARGGGTDGLAGAVWRAADTADGVPANPPLVTVGSGGNAQQYMLAPATPATAGEYDMFVGTRIGSNPPETLTFRRRHGVANAAYEVRRGNADPAEYVDPATYTPPAARPVTSRGTPRRSAPPPVGPVIVRN
jgi:hypothetical protein